MFERSAAIRRPAPACLRASDAAGRLARVVSPAESKHLERVLMAAEGQWLQETECAALLEKYGYALQQAGLVSSQPPWRPTGGVYAVSWTPESTLSDGLELDSSKEEVIEVGAQRLGCCYCTCKATSAEGAVEIQRRLYWLLSGDASHSGLALVQYLNVPQQLKSETDERRTLQVKERAETGFTSVQPISQPLFTIQSYSPKEAPASGGLVIRLSVLSAREVGAAAICRLRANFGGIEASAVLVGSTVYCTVPAAQRPGRVPLFLTMGDGQAVSSQVDFCWLDANPVLHSQAARPAMPAACRSAAAGCQQPAAASGEEADESEALGQGECSAALEAARAAMREQRYNDAYDHFSTVVELGESSSLQLQGVLGRFAAAIKLGRVQQAAAEARLAQRLAPDDARGAVAVSLACMAGEDMGQALRSLKRAREADPSYPGIDRLAQAALEAGRRRVRARRQGPQEEQEQSDCASGGVPEPQQPSSSDDVCLPEESSDSAEAEEARVVVLGMRDKGHLLPEHVALRYPWPQAPRPVLHRLITPPQSATRKRPLPYSRCSSTISDGLTSEGQTSSEVGSPGALAAMDAAGIGSFLHTSNATVPLGYTPERAGVQGALAGLELGRSSAGRAASGLLEGLPSVVLEEPSGFDSGDADELGSQEPATTTQAAKAGCFFF